jgi:hypothetical protein
MSVEQYGRTPWYQYDQRFTFDHTNASYMTGISVIRLLERGITDHLIAIFSLTVSITSNMNNVIHILLRICPDVSFFWHHSPFRILCYRQIFYWTLLMIPILGFFVVNDFVLFVSYFAG